MSKQGHTTKLSCPKGTHTKGTQNAFRSKVLPQKILASQRKPFVFSYFGFHICLFLHHLKVVIVVPPLWAILAGSPDRVYGQFGAFFCLRCPFPSLPFLATKIPPGRSTRPKPQREGGKTSKDPRARRLSDALSSGLGPHHQRHGHLSLDGRTPKALVLRERHWELQCSSESLSLTRGKDKGGAYARLCEGTERREG